MHKQNTNGNGFTIVELLIVIVVIAILAAISIVAYSGIQQRAKNTAVIEAASNSYRMVQAYIAANGSYPLSATANACVTSDSGCNNGGSVVSSNTTFDTNMATIGTLPRSVPSSGTDEYGIFYAYHSSRTLNGTSQPLALIYYLSGTNKNCGMSNVVQYTYPDHILSTTGYTQNTAAGNTRCWVVVSGPSA